jgi:hypothetical protein
MGSSTSGEASDGVLTARHLQDNASLAELYDPLTMSGALIAAHRTLDRAVDRLFKTCGTITNEAERLALLFSEYERLAADGISKRRGRPRRM